MIACLGLAIASPAEAQDCLAEVDRLAAQYGVSTDQPEAQAGENEPELAPDPGDTATEDLAESGGVIEPPEQGKTVIIEPPDIGDPMATAPGVEPDTKGGAEPALSAAERTQIQALLTEARAAGEKGDTEGCRARLREARNIGDRAGG
jgi:hypothetical protein